MIDPPPTGYASAVHEKLYLDNYSRQLRLELRREAVRSLQRRDSDAECTFRPATNSQEHYASGPLVPVFDRLSSAAQTSVDPSRSANSAELTFRPAINHAFDEQLKNWSQGVPASERLYGLHLHRQELDRQHAEATRLEAAEQDAKLAVQRRNLKKEGGQLPAAVERQVLDATQREIRLASLRQQAEQERRRENTFRPEVHRDYSRPQFTTPSPRETASARLRRDRRCSQAWCSKSQQTSFDPEEHRRRRDELARQRECQQRDKQQAVSTPQRCSTPRRAARDTWDRLSTVPLRQGEQRAAGPSVLANLLRESHASLEKMKTEGIISARSTATSSASGTQRSGSCPRAPSVQLSAQRSIIRSSTPPPPSVYLSKSVRISIRKPQPAAHDDVQMVCSTPESIHETKSAARPSAAALELARQHHFDRLREAEKQRSEKRHLLSVAVSPKIQSIVDRHRGKTRPAPFHFTQLASRSH